MSTINDGGPVHPIPEVRDADGNGIMAGWNGMCLRDWFAGQALAGLVAGDSASWDSDARNAYKAADAMLRAREAKS